MADENKNESEEQDDFFGDDEDFGLPDLEYEALDGDDDSADEPVSEEVTATEDPVEEEKAPEPEPEPEPEPAAEAEDDFGAGLDLDAEFGADDDMSADFSDSSDSSDSTDSADSASDSADPSGDDADDLGDDFYSEDDFGDFDASDIDLDEEIPDSVFDSDVLDDDEFKDFESELAGVEDTETAAAGSTAEAPSFSDAEAKASKGKFTKIVIFGTILFVALGSIFWYAYNNWGDEEPKKVAKKETPKKAPAKKPTTAANKPANQPAQQPESNTAQNNSAANNASNQANNQQASNAANNRQQNTTPVTTTPGTVNTLDARTGNSFVIIGSFVDEDIASDYANKLAAEGKSPSIIPPFGNGLFYRVAIAGFPTVASATQNLENYKGEYGDDVWVLKY